MSIPVVAGDEGVKGSL